MYKKKSIFTLLLSVLFMLPFYFIVSACGEQPNATGISVYYNNEDITENGKTLYVEFNDQLNLDNHLRIELNYDNGSSEVLSKKTDTTNGYFITSNIPENMLAGETYTYVISYGNYADVVITVVVDKAQNTISISKDLNKVYDKNKVTFSASDYSLLFDVEATIKWYSIFGEVETELQEPPAVVGDYKVVISVPETENYRATSYEKVFAISQATPNYKIPTFADTLYSDTIDSLSDVLLPTGFAWMPNQELEVGTNVYKVSYTPTDTANYKTVSDISVQLSYKQLIEKPEIVGTYFYNPNGEVSIEYSSFDEDAIVLAKNSDSEVQTESGIYTIRLKLTDTSKYVWADKTTDNLELTWVISKLTPSFSVPQIDAQHYTNDLTSSYYSTRVSTLNEIDLPEGFEWLTPTQALSLGRNNYLAKYVSLDENYNVVESINIPIEYYMYLAKPTFETITYSKVSGGMSPNISNLDDRYMTIESVDNGSNLKQNNAGIYYYQITLNTDLGAYLRWSDNAGSSRSVSWVINKQTVSGPTIANNNINYTGDTIDVIWGNDLVLDNTLPYSLNNDSDSTTQINSGKYKFYFKLNDPLNYKWVNSNETTIELIWTINAVDADLGSLPEIVLNGVYSPTQTLANFELPEHFTWENPETIPTCDVNTYKALYNLDPNNYNDVEVFITLNLSKAIPSYTIPSFVNVYYSDATDSLTDIVLPEGFVWQENQELVLGLNTYNAKFIPSDIVNYQTIENIEIQIVYKELISKPAINGTYAYNPSGDVTVQFTNYNDSAVTLAEGSDAITQINSGLYTIVLKLTDTSKYVWEDKTIENLELEWLISKLPSNVETPVITAQHYTNDNASEYAATSVYSLGDIDLPQGFEWINPETTLTLGNNTYFAKYIPSNDNYENIDSVEISIAYYYYIAIPSIDSIDYSYSESGLNPNIVQFNHDYMSIVSETNGNILTQQNAGTYNYIVSLNNEFVYWSDGTNTDKTISWTINTIDPICDSITIGEIQYSDTISTLDQIDLPSGYSWKDGSETLIIGVNSYTIVFTPVDTVNYNTVELECEITYIGVVTIPETTNSYNYFTGEEISPVWNPVLENCFIKDVNGDMIENYSQTDEGEYIITVALDSNYYVWSDRSTEDINYSFVIEDTPFASIKVNGEDVTLEEFTANTKFLVGTTLSFELAGNKTMTINGEAVSEYVVNTSDSVVYISVNSDKYLYTFDTYLIDEISIGDSTISNISLSNNSFVYEMNIYEDTLTISLPEMNNYNVSYATDLNEEGVAISNNTFTIDNCVNGLTIYIVFNDYSNTYISIDIVRQSILKSFKFNYYDIEDNTVKSIDEESDLLTKISDNEYLYSVGLITDVRIELNNPLFTYKLLRDSVEFTSFEDLNSYGDFSIAIYDVEENLVQAINIKVQNTDICNLLGIKENTYISDPTSEHYQKLYISTIKQIDTEDFTKVDNVTLEFGYINYEISGISYINTNIVLSIGDVNYTFKTTLIINIAVNLADYVSQISFQNKDLEELDLQINQIINGTITLSVDEFDKFVNNDTSITCLSKSDQFEITAKFDFTKVSEFVFIELIFNDILYGGGFNVFLMVIQ